MSENQEDQNDRKPSPKEKLVQEVQNRLEEAKGLQEKSLDLHKQAEEEEDPEVAKELESQAREIDKKAAKLMKTAERLQSGWAQGGAMGTGIGTGIAGGVGVVVGTLVTGLVTIPTSGLGLLIGAGTGLVHGPWAKYTDAFSKDEADSIVEEAQQEADEIKNKS